MISVSRTIRSTSPLERSWDFLHDFVTAEEWDPGTVTCRRLGTGPVGVGTKYENVSEFRGRKTTLEYEILEFDPARRLKLRGQNKTVQSIDTLEFSGSTTGTQVVYTAEFTFKGLARYLEFALKRPINKLADDTETQLTKSLDALS